MSPNAFLLLLSRIYFGFDKIEENDRKQNENKKKERINKFNLRKETEQCPSRVAQLSFDIFSSSLCLLFRFSLDTIDRLYVDQQEFPHDFTMGRKLANLWSCTRENLCGAIEIATLLVFLPLNGPRSTIGSSPTSFLTELALTLVFHFSFFKRVNFKCIWKIYCISLEIIYDSFLCFG